MIQQSQQLRKELEGQFTIATFDFNEGDNSVQTFVFRVNVIDSMRAYELFADYETKYDFEDYDGAFEDYLTELGIEYFTI